MPAVCAVERRSLVLIEVSPRLFIGDQSACCTGTEEIAVVHACKDPCHRQAVGYTGSLPPGHPQYLACEDFFDLYMNLIDPPTPLFQLGSFAFFREFARVKFIDEGCSLLIHCNQGNSRAPSLALLYLAKLVPMMARLGLF
jgi:hypothetical protein